MNYFLGTFWVVQKGSGMQFCLESAVAIPKTKQKNLQLPILIFLCRMGKMQKKMRSCQVLIQRCYRQLRKHLRRTAFKQQLTQCLAVMLSILDVCGSPKYGSAIFCIYGNILIYVKNPVLLSILCCLQRNESIIMASFLSTFNSIIFD